MHLSHRLLVLGTAVAAFSLTACAGSGPGFEDLTAGHNEGYPNAEKLAEEVMKAVNDGKLDKLALAFPSDDILHAQILCGVGLGPLEGVRSERARTLAMVAAELRAVRVESAVAKNSNAETWQLFVDRARSDGCTLNDDLSLGRLEVVLVETVQGVPRRWEETYVLMSTDAGWFLAGAQRFLRVAPPEILPVETAP
jgi:hypothetical protein